MAHMSFWPRTLASGILPVHERIPCRDGWGWRGLFDLSAQSDSRASHRCRDSGSSHLAGSSVAARGARRILKVKRTPARPSLLPHFTIRGATSGLFLASLVSLTRLPLSLVTAPPQLP